MKSSTFPTKVDLVVVGGGILGAFHAWHALEQGLSVALLERHTRPRGASVRNFGQIVPSGMGRAWQVHGRESLRLYQSIQSRHDVSLSCQGSLYVASNPDELTLLEELFDINRESDYPSELWTQRQCLAHIPALVPAYTLGGLHFPEEASVDPRVFVHRVLDLLYENDRFHASFGTPVVELIEDAHGVQARLASGKRVRAAKAVLCCGNELDLLFPDMFAQGNLHQVKLQMLRLQPQPGVRIPGNLLTGWSIRRYESFAECPSWDAIRSREIENTFQKKYGVHLLFKQSPDGTIIVGDSHEYTRVDKVDGLRNELSYELRADITNFLLVEAQKILQLPRWDLQAQWVGHYCQTSHPSRIFRATIGETIHVVTGIGGKGMTASGGFAAHHLKEIIS